MSTHTREPWKADGGYISGDDGLCVANTMGNAETNASRIVACVNACAGYPLLGTEGYSTEHLQTVVRIGGLKSIAKAVENERDSFMQQRDELIVAMKKGAELLAADGDELGVGALLHDAIAKAEAA